MALASDNFSILLLALTKVNIVYSMDLGFCEE